jgi:alpha-N-arabinofuranosidase
MGSPGAFAMHYYQNGGLAPTAYTVDAMNRQLSLFQFLEQAVVAQRAQIDAYNRQPRVGLILDEWGVWDRLNGPEQQRYGQLWQQSTMRSAVAAGLGLNIFNRHAEKLFMCNIAQIVNVLQSVLLTDGPQGEHCVRTTTYHAFALFKPHRTKMAVKVENASTGPLDLSVSASKAGSELIVSLVNPKADTDMHVECSLDGKTAKSAAGLILHHKDLNAANTFESPDTIVPMGHPVQVAGSSIRLDLPALSVATVTVQLG